MSEQIGTLVCGSFMVNEIEPHWWEFTCRDLPDWAHRVVCSEQQAFDLLYRIQAENQTRRDYE